MRKLLPCKLRLRGRSCVYVGLLSLVLQLLIFILLLYILEENDSLKLNTDSCSSICKDIRSLAIMSKEIGVNLIILDKDFLQYHKKPKNATRLKNCYYCPVLPVVLGLDSTGLLEKKSQLLRKLIDEDFVPVTFYNRHPAQTIAELDQVEISLILQRTAIFHIVIFHPREDNTWWFGDIHSDPSSEAKLLSLNLTLDSVALQKSEGAIERFEVVSNEEVPYLMFPRNIQNYVYEIENSKFVECDVTRAGVFRSQYETDTTADAVRFRHKSWKVLSKVKTIMKLLNTSFWLSSGTALGYFRECDIIAHSKDVDIGIFASSYSDKMITVMQNYGFQLKISLGFPNDSFELSFIDQSGVKLDIFFFYEDEHSYWNGGTQVKSGKKFKYKFPKFTLCWTLFKDLKLQVPCEIETYIQANYGPNWFTPVKSWDWKTSPFNVQPNGMWGVEQLAKAVKVFP